MSYMIVQKNKGGTLYFSNFLFPHWEGELCLGVTKFKDKRKAQAIAKQIGGKVEQAGEN